MTTRSLAFLGEIGPGQFSRACLLLSALVLIVICPAMFWLCPGKLPSLMQPRLHRDFYQYYAGGVVVRHGLWDSLYPIPRPGIYDGPNHFVPTYRTFLFNPSTAGHAPEFYPPVNLPKASVYAPGLVAYFPQADSYRFIYPPPTALFLWPLSWVSFDCAANRLWPTICIWSFFLLSYFASRIHRIFRQGESYTEGLIILACVIFTLRGETHIPDGNVTPILAALIAFSAYALMRGRLFAFACAYIPLFLFKTLGLTWLPLLLIKRAYWRTLAYLGAITLFLNGIVVMLAGLDVYKTFFSLASKIAIPAGVGIVPSLIHLFGYYPHFLVLLINLIFLGLLYYGYWKSDVRSRVENPVVDSPLSLVALLAGAIALFCLTNLSVWIPYCGNYLFFPFLGWMLQEGYLASGYWRHFIFGGVILSFLVLTTEGAWMLFLGSTGIAFYQQFLLWPSCILLIPAFFLIVALRRLLFTAPSPAPSVK